LRIKAGSDNYGSRSTQSLNYEPKQKNLETMKVNTVEKETFAAEWDIQDTHKEKQLNFEEQTTKEMYLRRFLLDNNFLKVPRLFMMKLRTI